MPSIMALTIYLIAETISHGIASYNHKPADSSELPLEP